mmetsp:Transcript_46666/g.113712  ORF Transcript_46666/g.113712 Transcript_46666/m.113712 type:complete len:172 (-) Transcript_46666:1484-1999(-)
MTETPSNPERDAAVKNNNGQNNNKDRGQVIRKLATDRLKRAGIEQLDQLIADEEKRRQKKNEGTNSSSTSGAAAAAAAATAPKTNTITEILGGGDMYDTIELGIALGHGQFHAVYEIKSLGQDSGFPFKIRKNPLDRVVLKTLRGQMSSPSASVEKNCNRVSRSSQRGDDS